MNLSLQVIATCAIISCLGQVIRILVGFYKIINDKTKNFKEEFNLIRLSISILISFIVGIAFGLTYKTVTTADVLPLIGIGYSGTDALESLITKYIPTKN